MQQNFEGLLWGPIALTTLAHYVRPKARAEDNAKAEDNGKEPKTSKARAEDDLSSAHRLH